jgi:hypothetical protein
MDVAAILARSRVTTISNTAVTIRRPFFIIVFVITVFVIDIRNSEGYVEPQIRRTEKLQHQQIASRGASLADFLKKEAAPSGR